jgi:hypothetical protein
MRSGMKDGAPFGLARLWENWRDPATNEWVRTFTIITVPSNEMIARIFNRMPAILRPEDYERCLGPDPHPHDLLITYPSGPMKMWPISKRVNSPRNDDAELLTEIDLTSSCGTNVELDMTTLVWTRGAQFPLERLAEVLKYPRCSERKLRVMFEVPNEPTTLAKRKRLDD